MKDKSETPMVPGNEDTPEEENDGIAKQPIRHNTRPQRKRPGSVLQVIEEEETPIVSNELEQEEEEIDSTATDQTSHWEDQPEEEQDITLGLMLYKEFPGHGSFTGKITGINTHETGRGKETKCKTTYAVRYEDGDKEELYASEVRPLVSAYQTLFGPSPGEEIIALTSTIMASDVPIPKNYQSAINSDLAKEWTLSINKELQGMIDFKVWDVVPRTEMKQARPISTTYVFKAKPNADGSLERLKARVCARGFLQRYGTDFLQTFAPVARLSTIRLQVALSTQMDLEMRHLDFKSAFLQGELDIPLFMEQPDGLQELMDKKGESIPKDHVLRLKKGIYGLKQAGRIWYQTMANGLIELGFTRSPSDSCLFYILNPDKSDIILITTWVDDCIVSFSNPVSWNDMLKKICAKFTLGTGTDFEWCLGMAVSRNRDNGTICLHQSLYVKNLLKQFHMEDSCIVRTPADSSVTLSKEMAPKGPDEVRRMGTIPYRSLLGALLHLANFTRPDIALAVNICARYANCYGDQHWKALKRILRYLKGTIYKTTGNSPGLLYKRSDSNDLSITGFVDADYARCPDSRRSTTGYIFMCCGGPLSWESSKQRIVATSTAEAEYVALALAVKEAIWLRKLHFDLELPVPVIPLHEDNEACIKIAENPVFHKRTKHIDIRFHFIRDHLKKGNISVPHISTKQQLADVLTKPLARPTFEYFASIMVKWPSKRPWVNNSPLAAFALMINCRPKKKRRIPEVLGRLPSLPSVGVLSTASASSSPSALHMLCVESLQGDTPLCWRPHCQLPRSLKGRTLLDGPNHRRDYCSRACSALSGVSSLGCLNPSCSGPRAIRTSFGSDLVYHYDFCSLNCLHSHDSLRISMRSPEIEPTGPSTHGRKAPGAPRRAYAMVPFEDGPPRPPLRLSPPIDGRYPWITDHRLIKTIDSERWDLAPGLLSCLETQYICTVRELETLSIADLGALRWPMKKICQFVLSVLYLVSPTQLGAVAASTDDCDIEACSTDSPSSPLFRGPSEESHSQWEYSPREALPVGSMSSTASGSVGNEGQRRSSYSLCCLNYDISAVLLGPASEALSGLRKPLLLGL